MCLACLYEIYMYNYKLNDVVILKICLSKYSSRDNVKVCLYSS